MVSSKALASAFSAVPPTPQSNGFAARFVPDDSSSGEQTD
jgi:hypothetical protein